MTFFRILFLLCGLLLTAVFCRAADEFPDVKQVRKQLVLAINSGHTTDSLFAKLDELNHKPPLILAYLATLDALKAKHTWNPYNKIKYLNLCQRRLKDAVNGDPHNVEIRFMRFSIQHNVPGFLGYGTDLLTDREEMIRQLERKNYGSADKELTISIIRFLLESKRCTPAENLKLRQYLAAL